MGRSVPTRDPDAAREHASPGAAATGPGVAAGPTPSPAAGPPGADVAAWYLASLAVAALVALVSVVGLVGGATGLYGPDARAAGVASGTSGVLLPGFRALDGFNLAVALPVLVATAWLARRGSLAGLLLWPGALFYVLYTYAQYSFGAPFGLLFPAHVLLVVLSASCTIGALASIDGDVVRARLAGAAPARTVAAILVVLGLLTLGQDTAGVVATALTGGVAEPLARHVWTADLVLEVPALLVGGMLLWRARPLGYVAGAGPLLQFGMTPVALAAILVLQPWLTGLPADAGTVGGVLVFAAIPFAAMAFFLDRAIGHPAVADPGRGGGAHT